MRLKIPIKATPLALALIVTASLWSDAQAAAPSAPRAKATAMRDVIPAPVDRGELNPVLAADGSGLPFELWRGLDVVGIETLIGEIQIPPRSPALHNLWKRLITADVTAPTGTSTDNKFLALRLEVLYRSGLAKEAAAEIARQPAATEPLLAALAARNELAAGHSDKGCEIAGRAAGLKGDIPKRLKGQAILLSGYCAAAIKDPASAGLAADLAREEGVETSPGLDALDAISAGGKPKPIKVKQLSLIDQWLLGVAGVPFAIELLPIAEPALLVALANDAATAPDIRLGAAEAATRLNALSSEDLALIYRSAATAETADTLLSGKAGNSGPNRRAALFKTAETEQTPMKKTRLIRALIDDARPSGLAFQAMQMSAKAADSLNPQPEISWFAETGAEIGLASANSAMTAKWVALAGSPNPAVNPLQHWLALEELADAASASHGQYLPQIEALAQHGRFTPDALHRLVTVLDALGYNIPIPLWEAASRTPQPKTGYLPATGVLSQLQDASAKKEFGRTVLLAMKSLGPNGAEGANMLALGDSIRALKRAGLEADARRLAVEALFGAWPRTAVN